MSGSSLPFQVSGVYPLEEQRSLVINLPLLRLAHTAENLKVIFISNIYKVPVRPKGDSCTETQLGRVLLNRGDLKTKWCLIAQWEAHFRWAESAGTVRTSLNHYYNISPNQPCNFVIRFSVNVWVPCAGHLCVLDIYGNPNIYLPNKGGFHILELELEG